MQLAAALKKAGIEPAAEKLERAAAEAIAASPRNWDGAVQAFYAAVRADADMLWALLAPYRPQAAQKWLAQAQQAQHERNKPQIVEAKRSDAGQGWHGNHFLSARVAPEAGGQRLTDSHGHSAPRPSAASGMAAVAAVTRLSLLDTFKVNGQPIGELTSAEAVQWAGARERDVRFVRALTANLPANEPIKKYRTGEEAAAIYAQAENGHAE